MLACLCCLFCGVRQFHAGKVWLFSKKQYTGNTPIRVPGQQSKGPSSLLLCFLELKKGEPVPDWNTAYLNGGKFSVMTEEVMNPASQDSIVVGTIKDTKMAAVIKPEAGSRIIHLLLAREGDDGKAKDESFTLKGRIGKKELEIKSKESVVELTPDLMP